MENFNWREKLDQFKLPIGLSLVGIVLIIGGVFASGLNKQKPKEFPKESLVESQKMISVDVSGAVNKPGVYQLKDGSRIEDAVTTAGGFSEEANKEYVSKYLNMAQKLSDGTKVYISSAGEQAGGSVGGGAVAGANTNAKVNINTATQAELEALPGRVGPATASNIISGRPYQTVEELFSRKIVGNSVFEAIKESVSVY
ncbi:MAG: SLBB domain-containing protein [Candidatus Daviesbacteria bacterium]|nr:SLBB domain-containing protein [Candidatus Daviesbacteria bacterium]